MEKTNRSVVFSLSYFLVIELIIQVSARLISSGGRYFIGQPSNNLIYEIMEIAIRIFFIAITVYTFAYWKDIESKPKLFVLIGENFIPIYLTMSLMLIMGFSSLCF